MIAMIKGKLLRLRPSGGIIMCANGLGYAVNMSINCSQQLREGDEVQLFISQIIKEDSHKMYGFCDEIEQKYFEELIKVNGVGAVSAMAILSAFTPAQLQTAVLQADVAAIKKAPGIGPKTAQRLILELKDKLSGGLICAQAAGTGALVGGEGGARAEALAALVALGFKADAANKALAKASGQSASELVKAALRSLS